MFSALVLPVLVSLAAPPATSPAQSAAVHATVQTRLREIESGVLRGGMDALREKLDAEARARPADPLVRVYLAWCAMPSEETWNALKVIAASHPKVLWARYGMGRVYLSWNMREQAEQEFRTVLGADAFFYPALVGLGDVSRAAGKNEDAVVRYSQAISQRDDAEAHGGMGLAYLALGKKPEAKQSFERALALWPDQPQVLGALARLSREEGDLRSAAKWASAQADLAPRDLKILRVSADLKFEAGDKSGAARDYERMLKLGAIDVEIHRRIAQIAAELGDTAAEERAVEQLSALEKTVADHPARLAELAEARGDVDAAEAQLLEALERAPARGDLHLHLARVRVRREMYREAVEAYRAATAAKERTDPAAGTELDALLAKLKLPAKPPRGSLDQIYQRVSTNLNGFYGSRLEEKPELAGILKIRVRVDDSGAVKGVDVLEDTVGDAWVVAHAALALESATFPAKKRDPVFEFELQPRKGTKK
jgi:tetratricopeptide (TPR) repeat protein